MIILISLIKQSFNFRLINSKVQNPVLPESIRPSPTWRKKKSIVIELLLWITRSMVQYWCWDASVTTGKGKVSQKRQKPQNSSLHTHGNFKMFFFFFYRVYHTHYAIYSLFLNLLCPRILSRSAFHTKTLFFVTISFWVTNHYTFITNFFFAMNVGFVLNHHKNPKVPTIFSIFFFFAWKVAAYDVHSILGEAYKNHIVGQQVTQTVTTTIIRMKNNKT